MSRSSPRRFSINDVVLPSNLMKGLSMATLKDLNKQDDATFYQYFEGLNLEDVKRVREKSQKIRDTNKELAINNLELEPKLSELKTQLLERTSELTALKEEYDKKILELKAIQDRANHQAVEKELAQSVRKTEQESEDLASDFVGGKLSLSLEEFQEKFFKDRTLYWLRRVKSEKMKELLAGYRPTPSPRTLRSTPSSGKSPAPMQSLPPQPTPGYPTSQSTASLPPYPSNNVSMPTPNPGPFPAAAYARGPPIRPSYSGSGANAFNQHRY